MKVSKFTGKDYPKVRIDHSNGVFTCEDGPVYTVISIIPLGLVRTRTMWPEFDQGTPQRRPICVSNDMGTGYPDADRFMGEINKLLIHMDTSSLTENPIHQVQVIPCDVCSFRKFLGGKPPRCNVNWLIPFVFNSKTQDKVYVLMVTGSNVKILEEWLEPYKNKRIPLYKEAVNMTLARRSVGGRPIASLRIMLDAPSGSGFGPEELFRYSRMLHEAKEALTAPPGWGHVTGQSRPKIKPLPPMSQARPIGE